VLVGNSFQCGVVAWIICHWAVAFGCRKGVPALQDMRCENEALANQQRIQYRDLSNPEDKCNFLLVEEMARRCTHRGSDVRLDTGDFLKPDVWPTWVIDLERWEWVTCMAWKWKEGGAHYGARNPSRAINGPVANETVTPSQNQNFARRRQPGNLGHHNKGPLEQSCAQLYRAKIVCYFGCRIVQAIVLLHRQ